MPRTPADAPRLERIAVEPTERTLNRSESFSLRVTAHFTDGSDEDVTHLAAFASSESALVDVDADGRVTAGPIPGEATISARFGGLFANCDVTIPLPGDVPAARYDALPRSNFIDDLVWAKLRKLGLLPSAPAGDATFLRRAYLDVIGRLPTPDEVRAVPRRHVARQAGAAGRSPARSTRVRRPLGEQVGRPAPARIPTAWGSRRS